MLIKHRTQTDRTAATRETLLSVARTLFAQGGYSQVSTEAIVRGAGVTRGAMYHHFPNKATLFAAVFETIEAELIEGINAAIAKAALSDPLNVMRHAARCWLDACVEPEIHRIALLDAPAVLGWMRWREIGSRYGLGLTQQLIKRAIVSGRIPRQPVAPLANVLLGALRESALYLASAKDQKRARREVGQVVDRLIHRLAFESKKGRYKSDNLTDRTDH
ncbi:MAG TPA: TetR/AcrR family transcriptional regulator [Steroidobacteraceae bacterium]